MVGVTVDCVDIDRVASAKVTASRLRLAPRIAELHTETARLLSLGAIRLASGSNAASWAMVSDIEGNDFDLFAGEAGG
jgi:Glyoxalase-like domain